MSHTNSFIAQGGLSMKKTGLIFACLISVSVFAQSDDTVGFSFDLGLTTFLLETTTNDVLIPLGYTDPDYYKSTHTLVSPHIGANIHLDSWVFGVGWQRERLLEIDVIPVDTPYVDQFGVSTSWMSAYVERYFNARKNVYPYLALGLTHSKIRGFARDTGDVRSVNVEESDPFIRAGLSKRFNRLALRMDLTRRFTDDADSTNLIRIAMRYSFQ